MSLSHHPLSEATYRAPRVELVWFYVLRAVPISGDHHEPAATSPAMARTKVNCNTCLCGWHARYAPLCRPPSAARVSGSLPR